MTDLQSNCTACYRLHTASLLEAGARDAQLDDVWRDRTRPP